MEAIKEAEEAALAEAEAAAAEAANAAAGLFDFDEMDEEDEEEDKKSKGSKGSPAKPAIRLEENGDTRHQNGGVIIDTPLRNNQYNTIEYQVRESQLDFFLQQP